MDRFFFLRVLALSALMWPLTGCASNLLNLTGANSFGNRLAKLVKEDPEDELAEEIDNEDFETRVETPLLRDYISVSGNNMIALRGVGLVTGLDGTGDDPPPSHLRTQLLEEMKIRKIPNPSRWLADRNTTLVMVTAYLPPMCRKGQKFDVRVTLPPNSKATSLKGGWLLETRLSEERTIQGRGNIKGHMYAVAHGAILTALGANGVNKENAAMLRRGSVPGGAVSNTDRDLEIHLRAEYRGLKTSQRIEDAISGRLFHYNRFGQRVAMATAKTDKMLELKVHPRYRNNFPRYQRMIRSIAFRETDVARRMRMESLARNLLIPEKAEDAALQLEALGTDSVSFLKSGLTSPHLEVRFHAAQALAYLEDPAGVEVLKNVAKDEPAFRVYALAALSVIEDADGVMALRELMSSPSLETRYGAVRALKENSPRDHSLGTREYADRFVVHAVQNDGPPAVHVVRYREPEIVLFGGDQLLRTPAVLNAGNRIVVMGRAENETVTITRYNVNKDEDRRTCSTRLIDILNTLAELDASYPDVVQMLIEAESQSNLMGELGIDRLPQAGRIFQRPIARDNSQSSSDTRVGTPSLTPGLFGRVEDADEADAEADESTFDRMFAAAGDSGSETSDADVNTQSKSEAEVSTPEDSNSLPNFGASAATGSDSDGDDSDSEANVEQQTGDDEFELEQTEFREPFSAKLKRLLPFGSGN